MDVEQRLLELEREVAWLRRRESRRTNARGFAPIVGLALVVGMPVIAYSLEPVPHVPVANEPIVADEVAANYQHLVDGITAVEDRLPRFHSQTVVATLPPESVGQTSVCFVFDVSAAGFETPPVAIAQLTGTAISPRIPLRADVSDGFGCEPGSWSETSIPVVVSPNEPGAVLPEGNVRISLHVIGELPPPPPSP